MKGKLGIWAIVCFTAATAEIVYLEDITGDHDKRNLRLGLPETMQFRLRHADDEVKLSLRENKHLNPNAPIYKSVTDNNGNNRIVRDTNIKPNHNVRYYQDLNNNAYMRAECMKREAGPCTRLLTGNLFVNGKEHTLEPAVNQLNTRELNSYRGTPHELNVLKPPEAVVRAAKYAREKRGDKTQKSVVQSKEVDVPKKDMNTTFFSENLVRKKRVPPTPHGVEVLLALDHTIYNDFAELYNDSATIKFRMREYFSHIINGVDTRYASIIHPDISIYIVITGFYISTKVAESPWMDYTQDPTWGLAGLNAMENWRKNGALPVHDHATLLTRSNIARGNNAGVLGISWISMICTDLRTSINEDHGLFFGAHILTHELGHNLGSLHDDLNRQCDPADRYLMAPFGDPFADSINEWRFSSCSVNSFVNNFVILGGNDCTLNQAVIYHEDESNFFLEHLAGTHFGLDEQCVLLKGTGASYCGQNVNTSDICKNFMCMTATGVCSGSGASDGTPCGNDNICFESTCQKPDVCRYRSMSSTDIAKDYQAVSQSSENATVVPAALALDGNMNTISGTSAEDNPWWKVQFSSEKSVFAVKVWNRVDCCEIPKGKKHQHDGLDPNGNNIREGQLANLEIKVDGILCGTLVGPLPKKSCFEVTCANGPILGTNLTIQQMQSNVSLNIAEVQAFAGCFAPGAVEHSSMKPVKQYYRSGEVISYECDACYTSGDLNRSCTPPGGWSNNVPVCIDQALYMQNTTIRYKSATQSSEHSILRPATLALDGSNSTFSQTDQEDNPSLQIEFCTHTSLSSVILTSRSDCCGDQFTNLLVTVDNITCGTYMGPTFPGATVTIFCGKEMTGKFLKITRTRQQSFLTLAEVQISDQLCPTQESETNIVWSGMYTNVSQSSGDNHTADLAVDDMTWTFSRTTSENGPWWEVQFCTNVTIGRVVIRHVDAVSSLFLRIEVGGETFVTWSGSVVANYQLTISAPAKTGKTMRISRTENFNTVLSLAEVRAFDA